MKKVQTYLPVFTGFYGTIFEPDDTFDYPEDKADLLKREGAEDIPVEDFDEVCDFDFTAWQNEFAERMVAAMERGFKSKDIGIKSVKFDNIHSPRQYNFSNDSINVTFTLTKKFRDWWLAYILDNSEEWAAYLKRHCTSYDGFISFKPNTVKGWYKETEGYTDLDGCNLGFMLEFYCENEGYEQDALYYDADKPDPFDYVSIDKERLERYRAKRSDA